MKSLLIFLLLSVATVAQAQDVTIPTPVAAFFLERNEEAKILKKEVDTLHQDISILEKLDSARQVELVIAHNEKMTYDSLVETLDEDKRSLSNEITYLNKQVVKERHKEKIIAIGAGVLIILALLL